MNYKSLQTALKDYRNDGFTLQVKLNAKKEVLEQELHRIEAIADIGQREWELSIDELSMEDDAIDIEQFGGELNLGAEDDSDNEALIQDPWNQEVNVEVADKEVVITAPMQLLLSPAKEIVNMTTQSNHLDVSFIKLLMYMLIVTVHIVWQSTKAVYILMTLLYTRASKLCIQASVMTRMTVAKMFVKNKVPTRMPV